MLRHGVSLVKLAAFLHLDLPARTTYHCDPDRPAHPSGGGDVLTACNMHGMRWGYGFSVVHTAALAQRCPYDPVNFGEDYALVLAAVNAGLRCLCFDDRVGDAVALHVSHWANSSCVTYGRQVVGIRDSEADFEACFAPMPPGTPPVLERCLQLGADMAAFRSAQARKAHEALVAELDGTDNGSTPGRTAYDEDGFPTAAEALDAARLRLNQRFSMQDRLESSVASVMSKRQGGGHGALSYLRRRGEERFIGGLGDLGW